MRCGMRTSPTSPTRKNGDMVASIVGVVSKHSKPTTPFFTLRFQSYSRLTFTHTHTRTYTHPCCCFVTCAISYTLIGMEREREREMGRRCLAHALASPSSSIFAFRGRLPLLSSSPPSSSRLRTSPPSPPLSPPPSAPLPLLCSASCCLSS